MLKHHPRRHLVVVMDQAPPHTSKKTRAFIDSQRRLHVFYLPKYSPDWNPDEKVWNHLKHHELKGHQAKTKRRTQTPDPTKTTIHGKTPGTATRFILPMLCVRFFRMSHSSNSVKTGEPSSDRTSTDAGVSSRRTIPSP